MPEQRSLRPSPALLFLAASSLAVITLSCLGAALSWKGLVGISTTTLWYVQSVAWLALTTCVVRCDTASRQHIMRMMLPAILLCVAVSALPHGLYSDDLLRYQWDGWLTLHAVSPYAYAPIDPALSGLSFTNGSASLPQQLPYGDMHTIYPPGAQMLFGVASAVSGGNDVLWKLTYWVLLVIPSMVLWRLTPKPSRVWLMIVALSPVVLLHGFTDAHIDAFMAVLIALALIMRQRESAIASAIILGIAISIKYLPILFIPAIVAGSIRRDTVKMISLTLITVGVIYLPFLGEDLLGSLGAFTQTWQTNSLAFTTLAAFTPEAFIRPIIGTMMLVVAAYVIQRWRGQPLTATSLVINIIVLLSPVVHPWYLLVPLALCLLTPLRSTIVMTSTIALYAIGLETFKGSGVWLEHPAALAVEFLPGMIAFAIDVRRGPLPLMDQK